MKYFNDNLVSIIIPVYNINFYLLEKCINSCIRQTYTNIEILIIANGIDDNIYEKLLPFQKIDKRIKIYRINHKGVSKARNEGIKISRGKYIAFIDADDYVENNYIEKLSDHEADIVACSFYKEYPFKSEKNIITKEKTSKTKDEFIQDLLGFQKSIGTVWGKIFNSKYLKNNILLFNEELVLAEDAEFCLRLMKHNPKIIYIPNILYHYNLSNVSTVRTFNKFYFNFYSDSLKKIELSIDKTKYLTQWNNFVAHHLLLICVNYCFNLQNKVCYDKRKRMLKEILKDELFADSIRLCDSKDFPFTKKITLFFLKHKMYLFVYIISIIRNKTR